MASLLYPPVDWEERLVGDDNTNPIPSFCSRPKGYPKIYTYSDDDPDFDSSQSDQYNDLRFIQKMVFFRNRLCMLSGENVICSKPGDYFNFFASTALTVTDNDPIDVCVHLAHNPHHCLMLSKQQRVYSASVPHSNTYSVQTVRSSVHVLLGSTWLVRPDTVVQPVFSMGTTVGFTQQSGLHTSVMELVSISRDNESRTQELSKPVSKLMPFDVDAIANANDNNLLVLGKTGDTDLWLYRYFQNDTNRVQSAWFKWKNLGKLLYHCIMDDIYWYVSEARSSSVIIPEDERDIVSLQRIDLKDNLSTTFVDTVYADNEVSSRLTWITIDCTTI